MKRRRGFIQLAILHLLKEGALNGYQLMKELESRSDNSYTASSGTIYPALTDLVQKGFITLENEEKKTYTVTTLGLEFLSQKEIELTEDFWTHWKDHMRWKKSENAALMKQAFDELNETVRPLIKQGHKHPEKIKKLTQLIQDLTEQIRKEV